MSTTTFHLGAAQLTVDTEALFSAWLEKHLGITPPAMPLLQHPQPGDGERYIGTIVRADGSGHHLFRMAMEHGLRKNWRAAMEYAAQRHADLPDRVESALMFAGRMPEEYDAAWYWTREQHAGSDVYAWCQDFDDGSQSYDHKASDCRVVLVRRVAIQSFSH